MTRRPSRPARLTLFQFVLGVVLSLGIVAVGTAMTVTGLLMIGEQP